MARPFRSRGATGKRVAVRLAMLGTAATMMTALVSNGTAFADTVLPGGTGSYNVAASSAGLYIALAGNQLTGGTASVTGSYANASGTPAEKATAAGQGFLLSTSITGTGPSVSVDNSTSPYTKSGTEGSNGEAGNAGVGGPSYPPDCAQGGGQVSSGVGLVVGLGCGYATATVDSPTAANFSGPQALGIGNIASVNVALAGILNQVYTGGANQICNGLNGIPQLGQLLGTACTQVLGPLNPSVEVNVGNAYAQIVSSATKVASIAHSSSVDVSVFPGLDSGVEPLLRVQIPSATAESCEGTGCTPPANACVSTPSGGWSSWYDSGLIDLSGTLIDALHTLSNSFPDPIQIPSCGQAGALVNGIDNSPLNALINLQLASATASGGGVKGSGLEVQILPTQAPGGGPVIDVNGAGITTTASGSASPATTPAGGGTPSAGTPSAVGLTGAASSPTSVHTGEWWAGSLPLLAVLASIGAALIGWPRLRRFAPVARVIHRGGR